MNDLAIPDGQTFNLARDGRRLACQHNRVLSAIRGGDWVTLALLSAMTGDPEASISARLRDLRKPKFGAHQIERRYVRRGLHEYRLVKRTLFD